jgi:hypothetical protein
MKIHPYMIKLRKFAISLFGSDMRDDVVLAWIGLFPSGSILPRLTEKLFAESSHDTIHSYFRVGIFTQLSLLTHLQFAPGIGSEVKIGEDAYEIAERLIKPTNKRIRIIIEKKLV